MYSASIDQQLKGWLPLLGQDKEKFKERHLSCVEHCTTVKVAGNHALNTSEKRALWREEFDDLQSVM